MFVDTNCWLAQCKQSLVSKGDYTEPKTVQGIDFTKADVMKGGKEDILVLTDAFSKYS